jgi:hypothetical protein
VAIERNWKEFRNEKPRSVNGLYVSINERGIILLNRRAYAELGSPEAVSLLYDEENSSIGLLPVDPWLDISFPVQPRGVSGNQLIRALPFIKANKIKINYTVKFLQPEIEEGILVLDLNRTTRATQSPRTGWLKTSGSNTPSRQRCENRKW